MPSPLQYLPANTMVLLEGEGGEGGPHGHSQSDITGLTGTLANKSDIGHTHQAGSDPWTYTKLAADFLTSSATAVTVEGLSFSPAAGNEYEFVAQLMLRTNAAATNPRVGLSWSIGLSDGVAVIQQSQAATGAPLFASGNTNAALLIAVGGLPNANQSWPCRIDGFVRAGASPQRHINVQLASETAGTTVSIKAGSYIGFRTI